MVQVYKNLIDQSNIEQLLEYHRKPDHRTDRREHVTSKHPRWNIDQWPQCIIEGAIDKILDAPIEVEEVIFNESTIGFQIHADSGYNNSAVYKGLIFPLDCRLASTVFFNNYWYGDAAKFVRSQDYFRHEQNTPDSLSSKDQRIQDYTCVQNFTDEEFDSDVYKQYLTHIPYENLHGLIVDKIIKWVPGDVIVFDRHQLHCASNEHDTKTGVTVFTNLSTY